MSQVDRQIIISVHVVDNGADLLLQILKAVTGNPDRPDFGYIDRTGSVHRKLTVERLRTPEAEQNFVAWTDHIILHRRNLVGGRERGRSALKHVAAKDRKPFPARRMRQLLKVSNGVRWKKIGILLGGATRIGGAGIVHINLLANRGRRRRGLLIDVRSGKRIELAGRIR